MGQGEAKVATRQSRSLLRRLPFAFLASFVIVCATYPLRVWSAGVEFSFCEDPGTSLGAYFALGLVWSWSRAGWKVPAAFSLACFLVTIIGPRWLVDYALWRADTESARYWADTTVNCMTWWLPLVRGGTLALVVNAFDPRARPGRADLALIIAISAVSLAPAVVAQFSTDPFLKRLVLVPESLCVNIGLVAMAAAVLDWVATPPVDWKRVLQALGAAVLSLATVLVAESLARRGWAGHVDRERSPLVGDLLAGVVLFVVTRLVARRRARRALLRSASGPL